MNSNLLLTGGSGTLGRKLLPHLLEAGYTLRISSRAPRKPGFPAEIEWAQTALKPGGRLVNAVEGVDTLLHLASDPLNPQQGDVEATRTLLEHAKRAGGTHFFYISIVGIEHFPGFPYYAAKRQAEQHIEASGLPYTIFRATQFHDLLDERFTPMFFKLPFIAFIPTDFKFQLVDSGEVAARIAALVRTGPAGRAPDMGGPAPLTWGEIAQTWANARGVRKKIVHLPFPGAIGCAFREGKNSTPDLSVNITWDQYLARKYNRPIEQLILQTAH